MKKILLFLLLLPQFAFADEISFYGSYEARGAFQENEIILGESFDEHRPGPILNFDPNYAHKIGLGLSFNEVFDIRIFYDELSNKDENHKNQFAYSYPLAGKFGSIIIDPKNKNVPFRQGSEYASDFDGLETGTGSVISEYGYQIVDLEVGRNFKLNNGTSFRLMIGGRYAKYEQDMRVSRSGECNPPRLRQWPLAPVEFSECPKGRQMVAGAQDAQALAGDSVFYGSERHLDQKIDGFGPLFGLSLVIPIKNTNFSFVSSTSYSILFAKKDLFDTFIKNKTTYGAVSHNENSELWEWTGSNTEVTNGTVHRWQIPDDNNNISVSNQDVIIQTLNLEKGIQYDMKISEKASIIFTAGYKYSAHFGALNTYGESLKDDPGGVARGRYQYVLGQNQGNKEDTFISHGPFVKVGLKF